MLTKFLGYNEISEQLQNSIPTLEGVQTFQMLTGKRTIDNDPAYIQQFPMSYPTWQIPSTDNIWDAGKNKWVKIAIGKIKYTEEGKELPDLRFVMPGMGQAYWGRSGKFSLQEGNQEDEELWEYLWLSNFLENNPRRNLNVVALLKFIDVKQNSLDDLNDFDLLVKATTFASGMNEDECIEFAASMNWAYNRNKDVVSASVKKYAVEKPKEFLSRVNDPMTEIKATLKQAFDKGILSYDVSNGVVRMGDSTLVAFSNHPVGFDYLVAVANWSLEVKNGTEIVDGIRTKLDKKAKVKRQAKLETQTEETQN